ncbi:MAG: hypothetical protein Q7S35_06820 [Candidatus Limnocylindrales bacterium]|nr:hypothetical protein [Candidatus Limnocylindrales bacterium]
MNTRMWMSDRARVRSVRWLACAVAAVIALLVAATSVTAHGPDPIFSGRWNQNQSLQFSWRAGSVPAAAYQTAIKAAAADASATRGSQAATFGYATGASNLIGYGVGATCSPIGIACFSRSAPTSFSMWMREQGHKFDWGSLRWCQAYTTWPDGCYDVENIMLDEFGHVEILDHHSTFTSESDYTDAVVQTGSHAKPKAGWNAHAFGRCDVASLQLQYDMQGWGAKYSTCLDLATTLALTANPTAVAKGGTTTLTATLKVANVSSYVRLALNPVALRSVTLQQRAAGTTAWLPAGTMAYGSTSGTYTKSLSLQSRTEFRAVFAKPPGEGLRAATSPTVTVAVGQ